MLNTIFLINLFSSIFMSGLIWMVQLVHYPSFRFVSEENFSAFHPFHNRSISIIVMPVMITELITSGVLWWNLGSGSLHGIGFYLVVLIWVSTAAFSVPNHARLSEGKSEKHIHALVSTNWIRTILWTLKALLSLYLVFENFTLK